MRNRKNELDVDFIGDQNRQLTEKEAKAITLRLKKQKRANHQRALQSSKTIVDLF
jgi:hypothetical protein